jgi:aspartate carbamoyltransferase catalytic subunit
LAKASCPILCAGEGMRHHPSQAMLDAFTLWKRWGSFQGKTLAICGDLKHSRVARSNITLLKRLGVHLRLVAPTSLELPFPLDGVTYADSLAEGIEGVDAVMMLRMQHERMQEASILPESFRLDASMMQKAAPGAVVMHPGPVNRGVEITHELADDPNVSLILTQVRHGVVVRQAMLQSSLESFC